jgi:hypothetical protein
MTFRNRVDPRRISKFRKLRFDLLEDRRVFAGLEVFVFDDLNSSRDFEATADAPLSNKAVFIDLDGDGSMGSSEPWTVTDLLGVAHFENLPAGDYSIRLLGNGRQLVQSYPTQPADQGTWKSEIDDVLRVESDGSIWAVSGNAISHLSSDLESELVSIRFDNRTVLDAVVEPGENGMASTGFVLTQSRTQRELWKVDIDGELVKEVIPIDASRFDKLSVVNGNLMVFSTDGEHSLVSLDAPLQPTLHPIELGNLNPVSEIQAVGDHGFATLEKVGAASRLTVFEFVHGQVREIGRRSFPSDVAAWEASPDGTTLAISTADDFLILDVQPGLPTNTILQDAVEPILFDPQRNLLITGSKIADSELVGWNTSDWMPALSIPISEGTSLTGHGTKLQLDPFGRFLLASVDGRVYKHDLAAAAIVTASVYSSGTTRAEIGVRLTGRNTAPILKDLGKVVVNEDEPFYLNLSLFDSAATDLDGDSVVFVVRAAPSIGTLDWSQDGSGVYRPAENANGNDSIAIQAYDGFAWSNVQYVSVEVISVNDEPTDIEWSPKLVSENPTPQSIVAEIRVLDPDADSDYEYQVGDGRFSILDGLVRFVAGVLSFEKESELSLPITAVNRANPADVITRTLTIGVRDENDPPTSLLVPTDLSLPEMTEDVVVGNVRVIDEDASALYHFEVSDSRFEVRDGLLRLRKNILLDYETEPTVFLTLVGTDSTNGEVIERSLTLSVSDQNDAPVELVFNCIDAVDENHAGASIGFVQVIDQDWNEEYSYSISDSRFEIRRGVVSLKPGTSLTYAEPGYIDLTATATSQSTGEQLRKTSRLKVLADPTPHHNEQNPYDVDGDGVVTPLDPLILINYINTNGVGPVRPLGEGEGAMPGLDVDGDGAVTPIDILILINKLNGMNEDSDETHSTTGNNSSFGITAGEGEARDVFQPSKVSSPRASLKSSFQATDASIAGYFAEPVDELPGRRSRKR